jgi:hypothetical protein
MKTIRKSVFETNSSSTHSICVTHNDILNQLPIEGIHFELGEFGWESTELTRPEEKGSYLYTLIAISNDWDNIKYLKKALDSKNISYTFDNPAEHHVFYIDHGGDFTSNQDLMKNLCNEDFLLRFLFSSESFITTGNDNDDSDISIKVDYSHDEFFKL